jgi:hypothetical protein
LKKKLPFFARILWFVAGFLGLLIAAPWDVNRIFHWRGGVPTTPGTGWILGFFCILAMAYAIRGNTTLSGFAYGLYEDHICPECERVFLKGENPDKSMCPDCKFVLEPLEGFYARHPELKDIETKNPKYENKDN